MNMEMVFLAIVILLRVFCGVESVDVLAEGTEGSPVTIKCSHSNAFTKAKYFCKNLCNYDADILINTEGEKKVSKGRYSIEDKGNTFFVTINELIKSDSGRYWCGIQRSGFDTYNEVLLSVLDAPTTTTTTITDASTTADTPGENESSTQGQYIGAYIGAGLGVAVVLLALVIIIIVFIRLRNRGTKTSSDLCCDIGAILSTLNGNRETEVMTPPPIQHQETTTPNIYSNKITPLDSQVKLDGGISMPVSNETDADGLLYSSVTFEKTAHHRRSAVTVTLDEESAVYATVKDGVP